MPYIPNFVPVLRRWRVLVLSLRFTLLLAVVTLSVGMVIGLILALIRVSKIPILNQLAAAYINFFRGIPQIVYLVWLYFGISMAAGVDLKPLIAAGICLATQYGGYLAEIFRSGIEAIEEGQREAASSVGLTTVQTYQHIILPQAIRIVIPPLGNMWVGAIKDSSLVSYLGVMELMRTTMLQTNISWRPFEFYTVAALFYVVMVWMSSRAIGALEQRLQYA